MLEYLTVAGTSSISAFHSTDTTTDYILSPQQQLILQAGAAPVSACITVIALQDSLVEGIDTFIITLTSTDNPRVTVGVPNTATISIIDDDGMFGTIVCIDLTPCAKFKVPLICRSRILF